MKRKKISIINIFIPILIILLPNQAFAMNGDSASYQLASKLITAVENLSLFLYSSIAAAYSSLFIKIATIGLTVILAKCAITRIVPLKDMINFCIAIIISSSIAFNSDLFQSIFYDTFFDTLYRLDQFIVQSAANNMPGVRNLNFHSLYEMFESVDNSFAAIRDFAFEVANNQGTLTGSIITKIEALLIAILYIFTGCYFLIVFTVSILAAHMMLVLMPITISLYPFRKFRGYFFNCIRGMLHYGLVTLFACVAVSLDVFITNDLIGEADRMLDNGISDLPNAFVTESLMIAFISILLIKMSSEFASRVLATVSSELGNAAPMVAAAAMTMVQASYKTSVALGGTTASGARSVINYAAHNANNLGRNLFGKGKASPNSAKAGKNFYEINKY
jgi:hypothetical protein